MAENDRDDDDSNEGRQRSRDRGRDKKSDRDNETKLTTPQEIAKSYFQNWMNGAGRWGMDTETVQKVREAIAEHIGPDVEKFLLSNGLTLTAAVLNIRDLLISKGVPPWVAETLDEGLNDLLEGARTSAVENGKLTRQGANRVLKQVTDKMDKKFIEDANFESSMLKLKPEEASKLDDLFFSLTPSHQPRFTALKAKLKTVGDLRLFLQRLERLSQAHAAATPSDLLEKLEPAYGVKPTVVTDTSTPSIAGIFGRLKKAVDKYVGKADKAVTEAVEHPERAFNAMAAGFHSANNEKDTKRAARKQRINQLKGMR